MFTAKYCPVVNGMVRTCIVVTGQEGVWRLHRFDLESSDKDIQGQMADEFPPHQPETCGFVLVDLAIGEEIKYFHVVTCI